jgi:hypothetical protein
VPNNPNQIYANQPPSPALNFSRNWLSGRYGHAEYEDAMPNGQLDEKVIMSFDARQKYLDYLFLKESNRKSNIAIFIAVASLLLTLIQIFYGIKQDESNESPSKIYATPQLEKPFCIEDKRVFLKEQKDTTIKNNNNVDTFSNRYNIKTEQKPNYP